MVRVGDFLWGKRGRKVGGAWSCGGKAIGLEDNLYVFRTLKAVFHTSTSKKRLQRYDIIKEWICISIYQRKVGGHYEDSGL